MKLSAHHPFRTSEAKERYLSLYEIREKQWPVVSESRMVETSYGQTFMRISGVEDAQPLVLLPGGGANSLVWGANIAALGASYRTYALDNISDFGRSVYTRPLKSPGDFAKWLDELFDALAFRDKINLIGLSFGGWQAGQYLLRFPERLSKVVLLSPAATVLPLSKECLIRMLLCLVPHPHFFRSFLFWLFNDWVHKDETGRRQVEEMASDMYIASRCFKSRGPTALTVLDDQELRGIEAPTFFLVGENEKLYSAHKAVQRLNAVAPHIKTEIISQAGHDLSFLQAEIVNRKILGFLQQT